MTPNHEPTELPVSRVAELQIETPEQAWLIENLWRRNAAGLISGLPKTGKTWLGLDMAVSVASATPCLDAFPVHQPGRALVYLAEDDLPMVRERVDSIARHRGVALHDLDLFVITCSTLRIDLPKDRQRLATTVERLRPRFLLLDPLVRLHHLDENRAAEMAPLMDFLRQLQRNFALALAVVHHMGKKNHAQPGLAVRGSIDFYAFADSCLYLQPDRQKLALTIQHRNAPAPQPVNLALVTDPGEENPRLAAIHNTEQDPDEQVPPLTQQVLRFLKDADQPTTRTAIRQALRVNNRRLGDALKILHQQGKAIRTKTGWIQTNGAVNKEQGGRPNTRPLEDQLTLPQIG